jgi:transcriptional regulator with XRE-family HTH domain
MEQLRKRLGEEIRALRKQAGWNQGELAEKAELSVDVIGRLERGQVTPDLRTLYQLSGALQISMAELLRRAIEETADPAQEEIQKLSHYLRAKPVNEIRLAREIVQRILDHLEEKTRED